jgi:hypothetical protein
MIGDTLTLEYLNAIREAMSKIKEIDRSEFFNQYYSEVEERIKEAASINQYLSEAEERKKQPTSKNITLQK